MGSLVVIAGILLSLTAGCAKPITPPSPQAFDAHVEEALRKNGSEDAIQFFKNGGVYCDRSQDKALILDRPQILPLLERLHADLELAPRVFYEQDSPKLALGLVMELPPQVARGSVEQILEEVQEQFPGHILQQWGSRWLYLHFLNEEEGRKLIPVPQDD